MTDRTPRTAGDREPQLDPSEMAWRASHRSGMHWGCAAPHQCRVERLLDDLARAAGRPEPPLDVDALAKVLELWEVDCDPIANRLHSTCDHDEQAVSFAREYLRALATEGEPPRKAVGWHGDEPCAGPGCPVMDGDGDHSFPDPHGPDWYAGYTEGQRDGRQDAATEGEPQAAATPAEEGR